MKKLFIYQVETHDFTDTVAFGTAWQQAKAKATELHAPIFRLVIQDGELRQQVFYKSGIFNSTQFMRDDNVKVF